MQELAASLIALDIDLDEFSEFIAAQTDYGTNCNHTFKWTLVYLDGRSDVAEIIGLFQVRNILCDCELGMNFFASLED